MYRLCSRTARASHKNPVLGKEKKEGVEEEEEEKEEEEEEEKKKRVQKPELESSDRDNTSVLPFGEGLCCILRMHTR